MLDDLPSFNNDTAVTPVVGLVSPNIELQQLIASKGEVARIFAIPLDELIIGDRWDVQESGMARRGDSTILLQIAGRDALGPLRVRHAHDVVAGGRRIDRARAEVV